MRAQRLRVALSVFHFRLGQALLFAGVRTVLSPAAGHDVHAVAIGAVEAPT